MGGTSRLQVIPVGDRELVITRAFQAGRQMVFDCYTRPELLKRWLHGPEGWTMTLCQIDFRVGGALHYRWDNKDGRRLALDGIYRTIEAPARLVHTELFADNAMGGETLVTTVFTADGQRTTATQTVRFASREARDGAAGSGMADGMEASYQKLDAVLSTSEADI